MLKYLRYIALAMLLPSTLAAQDVIDTLLFWPVDEVSNDSYTYFEYDDTELDTVIYTLGNGGINDIGSPVTFGGLWRFFPSGYIQTGDYFEVAFTSEADPGGKQIEVTGFEFDMASRFTTRPVENFFMAYSLNSDFSDSTIIYDYPDANIATTTVSLPASFNYEFDLPIVLEQNETVYFRIYPYNAYPTTQPQMVLIKNTFYMYGIVRDQSPVASVNNLEYTRTCVNQGQVSWTLPGGFDANADTILVFAKRDSVIDQGIPTYIPNIDYGTAFTDLDSLDGSVPTLSQFENDTNAILVYRGTGTSVDLSNFDANATYYFAVFNVEGGGTVTYSNAKLISGTSPDELADVSETFILSKPNEIDLNWTLPDCYDSVMVVVKESSDAISGTPSGTATDYATGVSADYATSTSFFNGTDDTDGKVLLVSNGSNLSITGLSNAQRYNIGIYVEQDSVWSEGVFVVGYPNEYEIIITQTQSEGNDFVEFLTLTEIDFTATQHKMANYPACENGRLYANGGNTLPADRMDTLKVVPAGTFVRIYTTEVYDTDNTDGIVVLSSNNWALKAYGGDQVMIYTGNGSGFNLDCSPGSGTPNYLAAFNYGNAGWLEQGSGITIDNNNSYAPPSVSNMEMPSTNTPNFSLKDQTAISGDVAAIHDDISNILGNWSTGTGTSPSIKLKDVLFEESNVSGSGFSTQVNDSILIRFNDIITVSDSVDVRYMVIACDGAVPDVPADRYTCYTPNRDYTLADSVVIDAGNDQFTGSGNPCGTPTKGVGQVVYIGKDTTDLYILNPPCGSNVFVSVYAIKGNGITSNIGSGITESVLMPSSTNTYYSTGNGAYDDNGIWNTASDGSGTDFSGEFTDCISLVVEDGDSIAFTQNVLFGDLTLTSGIVYIDDINVTLTKDLVVNDDLYVANGRITFAGLRQVNSITGTGVIELDELEVKNSSTVLNGDKLQVETNVSITKEVIITDGDLVVTSGDTLTLTSRAADKAAYLGQVPLTSAISGVFNVERYLPTIATDAPSGSGQGVGWRYLASPVQGATYAQIKDDFICTGFTGSQYPNYTDIDGYYFPNIQKYQESVQDSSSFGFDGDHFETILNTPTTAPDIRNRRDVSESIDAGEGLFVYLGPVEATFDFQGTPNFGDIDVPLSYTDNGNSVWDGWNLAANPYPCPVNMKTVGTTGGNVDAVIYIWNAEDGVFETINRQTDLFPVIAGGQAFWAKVSTSSSEFNFEEDDKNEILSWPFYKSGESGIPELIVHMEMDENINYKDKTKIRFSEEATAGFDNQFDGYKLYSLLDDVSGISTVIEGLQADASINVFPELTDVIEVPIKVNIRQSGDYTLHFEENGDYLMGSCLSLHDLVLDSIMSIDATSTYTFFSNLRPENSEPRFILSISPPVSIEKTDATCYGAADGSALAEGYGEGPFTYTWYNANNEEIFTETTSGSSMLTDLEYGFYSVTIDGNATDCGMSQREFMISQPADVENALTKIDPTCNTNDGYINVFMDESSNWNISWLNTTSGQNGQISEQNAAYSIGSLGAGEWEITTSNDCVSKTYTIALDDQNPVVADFIVENDTVYLEDNEVWVDFMNTSQNAISYAWLYSDEQEDEDNSVNGGYLFTSPGVYGISLLSENENGCFDEITYELVVIGDATAISEQSNVVRSYIAYGNANPQYVIELMEDKDVQIQMMNSVGQIISSQRVNVSGKTFVDLPTYDLSSGIYLIITLDDGTRIDTKKLFVR